MTFDYLDEDIAYLAGMIAARGSLQSNGVYRIVIDFPYSYIETDYIKERCQLLVSLDKIRNRIGELSEFLPEIQESDDHASMIIEFRKKTILWRDIELLFRGAKDYKEFQIPREIFNAESSIKKEFIRGFADVNGKVRKSNEYFGHINRVYLDVLNDNWILPVQICFLLQDHLDIPVQTITWGHPNLRNKPSEKWTKREHQVKVFCEDFLKIGFYIEHKQKALKKLARENIKKGHKSSFCFPPKKSSRKNPKHPDENHEDLPSQIRGKHYDNFWMICRDMGCYRWLCQAQLTESD